MSPLYGILLQTHHISSVNKFIYNLIIKSGKREKAPLLFISLSIELVDKDMVHGNDRQFASWIRTTWLPYTQRLPSTMRELLIEEVIRRYKMQRPGRNTGAIHLGMVRLEVDAGR